MPRGNNNDGKAVAIDLDAGAIYVAGDTGLNNAWCTTGSCSSDNVDDAVVLRYDLNGNRKWLKQIDRSKSSVQKATNVLLDGRGNVFLSGSTAGSFEDVNEKGIYLLRLDPSNGAVLTAGSDLL